MKSSVEDEIHSELEPTDYDAKGGALTLGIVFGVIVVALLLAGVVLIDVLLGRSSIAPGTRDVIRYALAGVAFVVVLILVFSLLGKVRRTRREMTDYAAHVLRRNKELQDTSRRLADSKAEQDTIMETVNLGLFLVTPDFKISGQYSRELEKIFRITDLEGMSVLTLLQRLLTERMYNTSKDYFTMLFDKRKKQRTIMQINPLAQVEVNFANPAGGYSTRYLSFNFRRIVSEAEIRRVFVAVDDITERVELETQLRTAEARKDRQFEFLLGVLHVAPNQIDEFINLAREQLVVINTALRTQDFAAATTGQMTILKQRLETVFRAVHNIKGNAQLLKLEFFVNQCQGFESKLVALRNRSSLSGDDFLTVVIAQSDLAKDVDELQEVRQRFVGLGSSAAAAAAPRAQAGDDLLEQIGSLATATAESNAKLVELEVASFDSRVLSDERRRGMRDVLIQLVRNSIVHGVETPKERAYLGKPERATLTVTGNAGAPNAASVFSFTFRDDGHGLDPEAIKRKAIENGVIGSEAAEKLAPGQIVGLIFQPGFSTAPTVSADAGRGFGMDIVKHIVVDRFGGTIGLKSEPLKFTEFSISIPVGAKVIAANGEAAALVTAGR